VRKQISCSLRVQMSPAMVSRIRFLFTIVIFALGPLAFGAHTTNVQVPTHDCYGLLEGTVHTIGADASRFDAPESASQQREDASGNSSVFKAVIELQRQRIESNGGTLATRTVMEYLLSPLRVVPDEAGGER
jgi:hypothetical protein